jgi:RNA polymerase sigma-70 factor, ECF subfamily
LGSEQQMEFELIYNASCDAVLAYVLRRTDPDSALDAVAETWLIAWRRLPQIPPNNLPWLLGVARKVLANQRRSRGRRHVLGQKLLFHVREEGRLSNDPNAPELGGVVGEVLEKLSPTDREMLCLVAWEGLKPKEAAAVMGLTVSAFSVRLHRARKRFIKHMEAAASQPASGRPLAAIRSRDET